MPSSVSFYSTAMDHRLAQGDPTQPGPAAAWFRLTVPLVNDQPTSPAMRAAAAADFGNGVSWVLPADRYLFSNADLSLHLHRPPEGEWIGLLSELKPMEVVWAPRCHACTICAGLSAPRRNPPSLMTRAEWDRRKGSRLVSPTLFA
jgi:hypothetical protein